MSKKEINILVINAGSSSIKFAVYAIHDRPHQTLAGNIDRIGLENNVLNINVEKNNKKTREKIKAPDFYNATLSLIDWLETQQLFRQINAIGYRIVHGMSHTKEEAITDRLLEELKAISNYDPDHLPAEIEIIELLQQKYPHILQVACFDTSFHTTIPAVAKTLAIPKKYFDEGIQRYGFHGISYSYLMQELKKKMEEEANGRIILAHLGNGASLAAVKNGKCIDTSMGFTPAGGILMSTRSGDLDPGVVWYLMQKGLDAKQFNEVINHQSGLLGISGISSDMQDLLQNEKENKDAALAIAIFCYQVKKYIGGYAAALGGIDTLVFSGGIGENAASIRSRICEGLNYLGIQLNEEKNAKNGRQISGADSRVKVYVIPTNEELMIAKITAKFFDRKQITN